MNLSNLFSAVAHKTLVKVDLPAGSHQHELNGVSALKELFGTGKKIEGQIGWFRFSDDDEPKHDQGKFTFYDARAKGHERTGRSEWRFYYDGGFLTNASPGDLLVIARSISGIFFGLTFQKNSSWHRAATVLFGVTGSKDIFTTISSNALTKQELELVRVRIIDELDLGIAIPSSGNDDALVVEKFGMNFPSTREMSVFAREQSDDSYEDSDVALTQWLQREEQLFRALEKVIIEKTIRKGFENVDDFVKYSLSVQNRRKSRMGQALQNHLEEVFRQSGLRFRPQGRTEGKNRPDFLFPGETEYADKKFKSSLLVMLGAKSTSKDRWRQVLTEAKRIPRKHLCTLEPGISIPQTDEMRKQKLSLVIPHSLQSTYTEPQLKEILSLSEFISFVRKKQAKLR